ncbi:hypothetical protein TNCV_1468601 [Trichonephila clavipes]|uniref:Uncharacterized protein n=1 Tax=Trichonephila clavipes TaxID=2585209 RepID=A0A8X6S2S4_TRICX|nr:hypothetical protein TNCV_1468601 [Trichonephila clavipes]
MNRLLIGQDTVVDKRISTLEEDGYLRYSDVSIMGVTRYTHYASSPHLLSQTVSQSTKSLLTSLVLLAHNTPKHTRAVWSKAP